MGSSRKRPNSVISSCWKPVALEDEFLAGLSADGFVGLEELDASDPQAKTLFSAYGAISAVGGSTKQKNSSESTVAEASSARSKVPKRKEKTVKNATQPCHKTDQSPRKLAVPMEGRQLSSWTIDGFVLRQEVLTALQSLGFSNPTPIQHATLLLAARDHKDILGAAETGSGKTLAFAIPIINQLLESIQNYHQKTVPSWTSETKALVIVPSRELALQVTEHFKWITGTTDIRVACILGGMSIEKQHRVLRQKPAIVVGTPGRMWELIEHGVSKEIGGTSKDKTSLDLHALRFLVLDEADRLIEDGHFGELDKILNAIYSTTGPVESLQTFLFSATLALPDYFNGQMEKKSGKKRSKRASRCQVLVDRLRLRPDALEIVDLSVGLTNEALPREYDAEDKTFRTSGGSLKLPKTLSINVLKCEDIEKELHLFLLLHRHFRMCMDKSVSSRVLVFVNAVSYVYRLQPLLSLLLGGASGVTETGGLISLATVLGLHSTLRQKQRLKRLERFMGADRGLLISTDVAARGLDLPKIDIVVHLQPPRNPSLFVHRSGRTARASQSGVCVCFSCPIDIHHWRLIFAEIGMEADSLDSPEALKNIMSRQLDAYRRCFQIADALEGAEHAVTKETAKYTWFKKTADEADLVLDSEDELTPEGVTDLSCKLGGIKAQKSALVRNLTRCCKIPLC